MSFKCIQMKMQKDMVGAQLILICSHSTEIMQEIIFPPVIFYIQFVLSTICIKCQISLKILQFLS